MGYLREGHYRIFLPTLEREVAGTASADSECTAVVILTRSSRCQTAVIPIRSIAKAAPTNAGQIGVGVNCNPNTGITSGLDRCTNAR